MSDSINPTWFSAAASILSTFVALGLGVSSFYKRGIERRLRGSELTIELGNEEPFFQQMSNLPPKYVVRLCVRNVGGVTHEDVSVWIEDLLREEKEGKYESVSGFIPMPLKWTHEKESVLAFLSSRQSRYVDFGNYDMIQNKTLDDMEFNITTMPIGDSIVELRQGSYRVTLAIYTRDGLEGRYAMQFKYRRAFGAWFEDNLPYVGLLVESDR